MNSESAVHELDTLTTWNKLHVQWYLIKWMYKVILKNLKLKHSLFKMFVQCMSVLMYTFDVQVS